MRDAGLDEVQAGIKIARRNNNNLRYADDTTLMAESEEERGEWKTWLKTQHSKDEDHGIWSHHFIAYSWGNNENSDRLHFFGFQNHCRWWLQPWNSRTLAPWKKAMTNLDNVLKSREHRFANKGPSSQSCGFSGSHVWVWELDCEGWSPKNWCFWIVVLEKTLESPLDCKEIQPVHAKGDQSWIVTGSTDTESESLILWPPHAKSWLIGKDFDAGRDWRQEEKGKTEDEMAGWHHRLNGHKFG